MLAIDVICALILVQAPGQPHLRAAGEASVAVRPDQAEIEVGVTTEAPTAQAAGAQNAKQLEAVLAKLRESLGQTAEIKTAGYSLQPNYRGPREGGRPSISGYTAVNMVEVKTPDLKNVGKVIDVVTQSGANTIRGLRFSLKDQQAARAQALREAIGRARIHAEAMAAAAGVKLGRLIVIQQGEAPEVRPLMAREAGMMMAEAAALPTPAEPGTIDVRASVVLTFEIQ